MAALRREDVDYVPCSIYFNPNLRVEGYDLRDHVERLRLALDLGTDPVLGIGIGRASHPDMSTRTWVDEHTGRGFPVLYKQYETPAGTLRHGIRYTAEWPHGMDIPWDDFSTGHTCEPLIKSPQDVEAFALLCLPPGEEELHRGRPGIEETLALADRHGVAVRAMAGQGLATPMAVMGAEAFLMFAVDHPEAFRRLAEIDHETNLARIRLSAEAGAHFLKRFGGYEQTNFISPAMFESVVAPLLAAEVAAAHAVGLPIYYRVVTGAKPLLPTIAQIGFDCIEGFEPVLSDCSNEDIHAALGGRACVWTGVSSPGHLGAERDGPARQAVRDAMATFGPRGFILGVTNSIRNHWPWANTLAMIDEWKRLAQPAAH